MTETHVTPPAPRTALADAYWRAWSGEPVFVVYRAHGELWRRRGEAVVSRRMPRRLPVGATVAVVHADAPQGELR